VWTAASLNGWQVCYPSPKMRSACANWQHSRKRIAQRKRLALGKIAGPVCAQEELRRVMDQLPVMRELQRVKNFASLAPAAAAVAEHPRFPEYDLDLASYMPAALPKFGPTMAELMREQDGEQSKRHEEHLAAVQRVAAAAEESARSARESDKSAQQALSISRTSLMWTRIAAYAAISALAVSAITYLWPAS
jgi:hypothetical protein